MSDLASVQFVPPPDSDLTTGEHAVHVSQGQTGKRSPKPFRVRVPGLGKVNMTTSGRRTAWEVSHSADPDDPLATPLPYDAQTGGKSYREFPQD